MVKILQMREAVIAAVSSPCSDGTTRTKPSRYRWMSAYVGVACAAEGEQGCSAGKGGGNHLEGVLCPYQLPAPP